MLLEQSMVHSSSTPVLLADTPAGQQLFTGSILGRKGTVALTVWGTWTGRLVTNVFVLTDTAT